MLRTTPLPAPCIGDRLHDRFHLLQACGDSPAGVLFDALDEQTAEVVRLRFPHGTIDPVRLGVQHPTLVRHLAIAEGGSYMVMEDLEGAPLELTTEGSAILRVWEVAAQLMPLFAELHRHGVAHECLGLHSLWRDIDGHTRVVDLGIASELDERTSPYASPERRRGEEQDQRSDVYSLAALLFAVAEGAPPAITALKPSAPVTTALPEPVARILARAMSPRAVFRHADAGTLWAELEPVLREGLEAELHANHVGSPTLDEPPSSMEHDRASSLPPAPPRRKRPARTHWQWLAAAAVLIASVSVASAMLTGLAAFVWIQLA